MQATIARVTIDGREQDRDADLDHHQRFEVETSPRGQDGYFFRAHRVAVI
ncbi:hypothetical protein [Curtobacterium sp. MCBD17_032]|nr:hypothetical protein [Curtobacterium sp. MCBD17_032]